MIWLVVYSGLLVCLVNVVCICVCYGNLDLLEECYVIDLIVLKKFSLEMYKENFVFVFKKNFYCVLIEVEK